MTSKPTSLITGAGKRIGAEIARHLAARGYDLVLHYHRSGAEAKALASELQTANCKVTLVQANLEDAASLRDFWRALPPVTAIIHNASRYERDTLETFAADALRTHLAVNLEAPLLLTQGFMRQLPPGVDGNIIVLGDDALRWSVSPEFFTYAVSKHAWRSIIDLLAATVAPRARANLIALAPTLPGTADTPALFDHLATVAPLERTGTVTEVLAALEYLLNAPGVTGQVVALGNGMGLSTFRYS